MFFFWPIKLAFKLISLVITAAGVYYIVTGVQVYLTSRRSSDGPAQAIVVMGSAQYDGVPSADLEARLVQALALWRAHAAPCFVLTGGKQPGDTYTESQSEAMWLEARGVPRAAVLAEVGGTNTYESLSQAAAVLEAHHLTTVLLVSDPFHEAEILSISSSLGLKGLPAPTRVSPIQGLSEVGYYAREAAIVGVGRIIGWHRLEELHNLL